MHHASLTSATNRVPERVSHPHYHLAIMDLHPSLGASSAVACHLRNGSNSTRKGLCGSQLIIAMKTKFTRLALLLSIGALMPVAYAQEKKTEESKKTDEKTVVVEEKVVVAIEKGSIASALGDSATFSILTKALQVTGLDATLGSNKGTFTIFAPTDEAFSKLPPGALDKLMLPENNEKLRSLLLYHVLPGSFAMADLKNGEIKTMNGEKIEVDIKSNTKQVEDSKIASADLVATNGVIHSIDKVMVPHSLDGFAKLDEK